MNIEKLPSGSYRITQMYKGKRYRTTVPYKPTNKEAVKIIAELFDEDAPQDKSGFDVEYYLNKYLDFCRTRPKPMSPSTIKGYVSIVNNVSEDFKRKRFHDLTEDDLREELDEYRATHSIKSTKNFKGYLARVLAEYRPRFNWTYKLTSDEPKAEYEPTTQDIKRIIDACIGGKYEVAFRLASLGLRRGEICALTVDDLDENDILSINKSLVATEQNSYVIKEPKTQASVRRIKIPHDLAELIRNQGYVFIGNPNMLNKHLHLIQDKLGIPRFRFHMLRHFCVAYLHKEGFTTEQIMTYGGWSTDSVMKRAYRYNLDPAESQEAISNKLGNLFRG